MTDILRRYVEVRPVSGGASTEGDGSPRYDTGMVPVTDAVMMREGGRAWHVGARWQCVLGLRYQDDDGTTGPVDLANLTGGDLIVLTHVSGQLVIQRIQNGAITNDSALQLEIYGDAADGDLLVTFGDAETAQAGNHRFILRGMLDGTNRETLCAGTWDVVAEYGGFADLDPGIPDSVAPSPSYVGADSAEYVYTDNVNKVFGPLTYIPATVEQVALFIVGGGVQDYTKDYTVRQVTGGTADGYYICVSTSSTAPGGGTFAGGTNPATGIDSVLDVGDVARVIALT